METSEDNFDDGLQSDSLVDVHTPSPSILNSPLKELDDSMSDNDEDSVNVTIRPLKPPPLVVPKDDKKISDKGGETNDGDRKVQGKRRGLCGSARRRLHKMIKGGMDYAEARERAKAPFVSTPKRQRNDLDRTISSDEKPAQKKIRDVRPPQAGNMGKRVDKAQSQEVSSNIASKLNAMTSADRNVGNRVDKAQPQEVSNTIASQSDLMVTIDRNVGNRVAKALPQEVRSNIAFQSNETLTADRNVGVNARDSINSGHSRDSKTMRDRVRDALPAPSYGEIASRVRVGIMPKKYPAVELSNNQQQVVQEALLLEVIQQRREQFKPKFACCRFRPGFLVLTCQDKHTADWVKNKVPSLSLWEEADLVVVDEDKIPRPDELVSFFAFSAKYSNDMILSLIESQNDNLYTDTWRILRRHVKGDHVELVLSVDDSSLRKLGERQFVLNYRYGQILMKKKRPVKIVASDQNPKNVPEDTVMDSIQVQQNLAIPGTSGLGRGLLKPSPGKTTEQVNSHQTCAGHGGLNIQGQSNAHGNNKTTSDIPSTTKKSTIQCRLKRE